MKYSFYPDAEKEFVEAIDYVLPLQLNVGYNISAPIVSATERGRIRGFIYNR
jgi:hypothetical protein